MDLPKKTIYLAGPIVGVQYGTARDRWRAEMAFRLRQQRMDHIYCLSPMRGRRVMPEDQVVEPGMEFLLDDPLENAKSMLARDANDVMNCDMVVANLTGATRAAVGTMCEIGMAFAWRKPVVLIMEKEGNIHHHGFPIGIASFWVQTVEEAAYVVATLLTPGI